MNFRSWLVIIIIGINSFNLFAQDTNRIEVLEGRLKNTETPEQLDILIELSKAYWSVSPKIGIDYSDRAYKLAVQLNDVPLQAKALMYGGVNYWYMGIYDKAIKYYHDALRIAQENEDEKVVAFLFNNIGMVYYDLSEYDKAYQNYQNALSIMKDINDDIEYAKIIDNIAKIDVQKQEYSKALKNYLSIIGIVKKAGNKEFLLWVLSDIGQIYYDTKKYKEAFEYYSQSLEICNDIDNNIGKAMVLNNLGVLFLKTKKYDKALYYLEEGLKFAKIADAKDKIKEIYQNLSEYYSKLGRYKESLDYYELYKAVSDTIYNVSKVQKILEVRTQYEIETKEKENELLRKDNKIQQLEIGRQTTLRNFFIALTILVIILVVLVHNRLQTKKKINATLSEKNELITNQKERLNDALTELQVINEELVEQKKEIQSQADKLKESNATKDKLFSIIAHDLKGPFSAILGYSELLNDEYDTFKEAERKKMIRDIDNSATTVFDLLENMLTWASAQMNAIEIKKEKLDLSKTVQESIAPYLTYADQKGVSIINEIPDDITIFADRFSMSTVFGNLTNNSIKFTPSQGSIHITAQKLVGYTEVIIKDTGVGMNKNVVENLFKVEKNSSTPGTDMEKGTGLGLIIVHDFVKQNNAAIRVESEIGKGSSFIISVPDC